MKECPGVPAVDTLYVAIGGFSAPVEGIEFMIVLPLELIWLGDIVSDLGLAIGSTVHGISTAFFSPLDTSSPVIIQKIFVMWNYEENRYYDCLPIEIELHPVS